MGESVSASPWLPSLLAVRALLGLRCFRYPPRCLAVVVVGSRRQNSRTQRRDQKLVAEPWGLELYCPYPSVRVRSTAWPALLAGFPARTDLRRPASCTGGSRSGLPHPRTRPPRPRRRSTSETGPAAALRTAAAALYLSVSVRWGMRLVLSVSEDSERTSEETFDRLAPGAEEDDLDRRSLSL